jgi:uncharacterized RDD family membrane protein YckC
LHSTDNVIIDTPEQIALELPLAGIGSRCLALAIDTLLQFIFAILVILAIDLLPSADSFAQSIGETLQVIILFLLYWGYFTFFEIIWNGQTPGKRWVRIRIIKDSGRPITPVEAIGRNLVRAADMFPGIYAVGLICMLFNKHHKRLGDIVAGTIAVHDKAIERVSTIWNPGSIPMTPDFQTTKISPGELVLIETYLNRRLEIDPQIRKKTAAQIVSMIQRKLGIERFEGQSEDAFLEAVARKVRDTARYR